MYFLEKSNPRVASANTCPHTSPLRIDAFSDYMTMWYLEITLLMAILMLIIPLSSKIARHIFEDFLKKNLRMFHIFEDYFKINLQIFKLHEYIPKTVLQIFKSSTMKKKRIFTFILHLHKKSLKIKIFIRPLQYLVIFPSISGRNRGYLHLHDSRCV